FCLQAQSPSIDAFFQKYLEKEKVTEFDLNGFLLQLEGKTKDLESRISKLRGLIIGENDQVAKTDIQSLLKGVQGEKFESLIKVRHEKQIVEILVKDSGDVLTDALLLVNDEDQFVLIALEGSLRFEDLQHLDFDMSEL
ncbi:MAG: DUF4252 domain-containing protein, partial [Phaeodactylibacter sp.]|nr:DUF4252 domain-containing protein [Phaeodactylibacter sp.]